jgi:hypothetical protein
VAALCGTGIAACGPGPWPARVRLIVAATVLGCVGYGAYLMSGTTSGPVVLTVVALVVAAAAVAQLLPIGGFLGNVPAPALATLRADISRGYVRVFVLPVSPPGPDPRVRWIESDCTRQPPPPHRRPVPYADFFCGGPLPASQPVSQPVSQPAG